MNKKTLWFGGQVKPWEPGVYERRSNLTGDDVWLSKWTGTKWMLNGSSVGAAAKSRSRRSYQSIPWRGLANPPETA